MTQTSAVGAGGAPAYTLPANPQSEIRNPKSTPAAPTQ